MKQRFTRRLLTAVLTIALAFTMIPLLGGPVFADGLKLELVGEQTSFIEGTPVYVKASGDPDSSLQAWVGLYKKGETPGDVYSLRWYYVGEHEGQQVNITDPSYAEMRTGAITPGEYTVIIFGSGGYDAVDHIDITITEDPDKEPAEPSDELTLNLVDSEKTTYKLGEPVMIKATGSAAGAWVGLFKENETPAASVPSLRWYYIQDGYNGVKVDITSPDFIHNNNNPMAEGDYKILLFDADNYDNCVKDIHIKIEGIVDFDPEDFTLETDKTNYAYKEDIKVRATGTGIGNSAWVGLYSADTTAYGNSFLYYYYVKEANGAWTVIQSRTKGSSTDKYVGDGKYKLVIFADGGYNYPVKTAEITVTRDLKYRKVLRDPGCVTFGIEYVTYEDDTSEYREIPTLGGHIWGEAQKVPGKTYHKYVCERDPDHVKTEACKASAGARVVKAASVTEDGYLESTCDICGNTLTEVIPKLAAEPMLNETGKLVYNGKEQKPELKPIKDVRGKKVDTAMYDVTYATDCKSVGTHTVTVTFKDRYTGTYNLNYTIYPEADAAKNPEADAAKKTEADAANTETDAVNNPAAVAIKKPSAGSKSIKVKWKKAKTQTKGYQIAYATKSSFKGAKYKKVKGIKKTSLTIKKLKANKKYYVKVRAYTVVSGKTYYSKWSKVKTVKTKK